MTVTDPDGDETIYTHHADGEVTKVTDPLGHSRHATYKNHLTQTAIDAMGTGTDGTGGNTTTYGWDDRNNPVSQKLPMGATASVSAYQTIAGTDLPSDMTGANGRNDAFKYDTNGNTLSVTTSGTAGTTREYTSNNADPTCGGFEGQRCTAKDGNGKVTSFTYDSKGNLIKVKPPAPLGETTYTYDALGRVETVKDGRGITTVYAYDSRRTTPGTRPAASTTSPRRTARRPTSTTTTTTSAPRPSTPAFTVTYSYDGDGNVTSRTDASGTTKWDYDKLNRESVRTLQNGAQTALAYTPGGDVDFYTDQGRPADAGRRAPAVGDRRPLLSAAPLATAPTTRRAGPRGIGRDVNRQPRCPTAQQQTGWVPERPSGELLPCGVDTPAELPSGTRPLCLAGTVTMEITGLMLMRG
ncbi:hypothetical protein [Streptomyces rochei]|uniref:hypothetical protein n=1 Tax=Streptomyces rochei TaxID=1928 RepID=UPI0033B95FD1